MEKKAELSEEACIQENIWFKVNFFETVLNIVISYVSYIFFYHFFKKRDETFTKKLIEYFIILK